MITDYVTVAARDLEKLDTHVNNGIKDGWQPHGSLATVEDDTGKPYYVQPMVKYAPELATVEAPREHNPACD